jgi:hypothetical protein
MSYEDLNREYLKNSGDLGWIFLKRTVFLSWFLAFLKSGVLDFQKMIAECTAVLFLFRRSLSKKTPVTIASSCRNINYGYRNGLPRFPQTKGFLHAKEERLGLRLWVSQDKNLAALAAFQSS